MRRRRKVQLILLSLFSITDFANFKIKKVLFPSRTAQKSGDAPASPLFNRLENRKILPHCLRLLQQSL